MTIFGHGPHSQTVGIGRPQKYTIVFKKKKKLMIHFLLTQQPNIIHSHTLNMGNYSLLRYGNTWLSWLGRAGAGVILGMPSVTRSTPENLGRMISLNSQSDRSGLLLRGWLANSDIFIWCLHMSQVKSWPAASDNCETKGFLYRRKSRIHNPEIQDFALSHLQISDCQSYPSTILLTIRRKYGHSLKTSAPSVADCGW